MTIKFNLNGKETEVSAHPFERLLDVLRNELHFTGTKEGCGEGECGACSIFINQKLVNSCLIPVGQIEGATLQTIEGLMNHQKLHQVQEAFLKHGGAQCGICTPGMIMAATSLLQKNPMPSEADIREALAGNLCRCTGYMKIFDSILKIIQKGQVL